MEDLGKVLLHDYGLSVSTLPEKGRCLFTTRDFSPGEIILTEEPYVSVTIKKSICECCFTSSNVKRCSACHAVCYCGTRCQKSDWKLHHLECQILSQLDKNRIKSLTPSIRLMVKLYIRRKLQDEKVIPTTAMDNYNLVKDLESHIAEVGETQLAWYALMTTVVNILLQWPGLSNQETTENFSKLVCNASSIFDSTMMPLGTGLYPVISIINHSCSPNSVVVFEGRTAIVRAMQQIPKGSEVLISYIDTAGSTMTRQKALREKYFFICRCPCCIKLVGRSLCVAPTPKEPTFTCPVCMGALVEEVTTKCGHIFCKACIMAAIAAQHKCPTCRQKLTNKNIIRVYLPTTK